MADRKYLDLILFPVLSQKSSLCGKSYNSLGNTMDIRYPMQDATSKSFFNGYFLDFFIFFVDIFMNISCTKYLIYQIFHARCNLKSFIKQCLFSPKFSRYFMQDATSKLFFNPNFSKFSTAYSSVLSGYLVGRLTNQSYAIFATFAAYSFPALPNPQSCQTSGNVLNNA